MPRIVFEPIGEEIECGAEETILDAAFRAGLALAHGCREGQCSACKSYLLEGEVSLRRYSTFALSDTEADQGYTLLCRAMPDDEEVVVELLHVDEDCRLDTPIVATSGTVTSTEQLSASLWRMQVDADVAFRPGQYFELTLDGATRSYSASNLPGAGRLEFIVRRYPDGAFSGRLPDLTGAEVGIRGPYGSGHLRASERPVLLAAGGSGLAPALGILRQLAAERSPRAVRFAYGARSRDEVCLTDEVEALGAQLDDFAFTLVLDDEHGRLHEHLEPPDGDCEAHVCGPPPMVEAVGELLTDVHGIPAEHVHFDKFTTAVAAAEEVR